MRVVRQWLSNVIYQPSCLFGIQVAPLAEELCTKVGVQTLLIDLAERLLWLVMIYRWLPMADKICTKVGA